MKRRRSDTLSNKTRAGTAEVRLPSDGSSASSSSSTRGDNGALVIGAGGGSTSFTTSSSSSSSESGTSSMIVQFQAMDDEAAPTVSVDIPLDVTTEQLNTILAKLLGHTQDTDTPYAFYLQEDEIDTTLRSAIQSKGLSTETTARIRYQPLAVFSVLPVTRCTDTLPGHTDAVLHISFSPDGRTLASGGGDAIVRFWDATTTTPKAVCKGHKHHVLCTAWSPDGRLFASADKAGEVRVWDASGGSAASSAPLKGHTSWVTALAWEPLHLATHNVEHQCTLLASAGKDASVRVWNVRTGITQFVIHGHKDSIEAVKWGGSGLIYTASRDRTVMVWAVAEDRLSAKLIRTLSGHAHRVNSLALNTDYLCRTGAYDPAEAAATALGLHHSVLPESSFSSSSSSSSSISSATTTTTTTSSSSSSSAASSAAATAIPDAVSIAKARYEKGLRAMGGVELLVSCSDDFSLFLWQPADASKPVVRMLGHQQAVNHISFSPDGRFLASACFDKKVKLWDGHTGKYITTFAGHVGPVYQVCWSADSRLLASASRDSTVKVWSAKISTKATKQPVALHTLSGHEDEVFALDWSPDGEIMASGGRDRVIKL